MLKILIDNKYAVIQGASRKLLGELDQITSYPVKGYYFTTAFKNKIWDGREHLLKFKAGASGGYRVPVGMLEDVTRYLKKKRVSYRIVSGVHNHTENIKTGWNPDLTLRDYQQKAVDAICSPKRDIYLGRGILKMPIRSGKTKTAAGIIHRLKARTLFLVPSQMLLHQTQASLEDSLQVKIGAIGDSAWDPQDITVATIQAIIKWYEGYKSYAARIEKAKEERDQEKVEKLKSEERTWREKHKTCKRFLESIDLLIFDECHHLRGKSWRRVVIDCDAAYKIGLSATVNLDSAHENELGEIWLKASTGNVVVDVSTTKLIREGWLVQPTIELRKVHKPEGIQHHRWSNTLQSEAIYNNAHRNAMIVEDVIECLRERGMKVLVITNRIEQIEALGPMLEAESIPFNYIIGRHASKKRKEAVEAFVDGSAPVLMGTVFGEGIDIPEIEAVVNAQGGRSDKATIQRMRNLTPHEGKTEAVFKDYVDLMNPYFATHSKERLAAYRSEKAFRIKLLEE